MTTSKSGWSGFERRIAKALGGARVYASGTALTKHYGGGVGDGHLGDVTGVPFLIECKLRAGKRGKKDRTPEQIILCKMEWVHDIREKAKIENKIFGCVIVQRKYGNDPVVVIGAEDWTQHVKVHDVTMVEADPWLVLDKSIRIDWNLFIEEISDLAARVILRYDHKDITLYVQKFSEFRDCVAQRGLIRIDNEKAKE